MKIELSADQCRNIAEFIDMHIFEAIRDDVDIDNIEWLKDMMTAHTILEEAGKEETK